MKEREGKGVRRGGRKRNYKGSEEREAGRGKRREKTGEERMKREKGRQGKKGERRGGEEKEEGEGKREDLLNWSVHF